MRSKQFTDILPLNRAFYDRETIDVARDLLGKVLVHVVDGMPKIGRIVEVEAYLGTEDKACHSSRGLTSRTRVMFGPPGHAYVYMIYGMYYCMNVVTEKEGNPCAVLIRALEPVLNISQKTKGPGLLCQAMKIDKRQNGLDLLSAHFFIGTPPADPLPFSVVSRPRIGVHYAGDWKDRPLRFYIGGSPYISRK